MFVSKFSSNSMCYCTFSCMIKFSSHLNKLVSDVISKFIWNLGRKEGRGRRERKS